MDTLPETKRIYSKSGHLTEYIEGERGVCFADQLGAKYYAQKHNISRQQQAPILIEVKVDYDSIAIDGRDFLYTIFARLRTSSGSTEKIENALVSCFGAGIKRYIEKCNSHPSSDINAICDLIISDNRIKEDHYKNNLIIKGRYATHFKCSFFVKMPLHADQIINVVRLEDIYTLPVPDLDISNLI